MQLSCQPIKNMSSDRLIPFILIFTLCPIVLFFQRHAIIILALAGIWSISYLKKIWTPLDVHNVLKRQISPTSAYERYLNYGLIVTAFFDFFRPYESHRVEFKTIVMLICGYLWWHAIQRDNVAASKIRAMLFWSIATCCILILIHQWCGSPLVTAAEKIERGRALIFSNAAMTLALVMWPAVYKQPFWKICILSAALIGIMPFLDCDTAIGCILIGLFAYSVASIEAKLFWRFIQAKIIVVCLLLPFAFNMFLSDDNIHEINKYSQNYSYIHRLYIWQYVSQKIKERPLIGFGLEAGRQTEVGGESMLKPFYEKFENDQGLSPSPVHGKQIPSHPHNAILQWWLESGLIGALWWAALLVFLVEKIRLLPLATRKITFAFFTANMMILLVSIGFWQSWWWATWLFLLPLLTISKK